MEENNACAPTRGLRELKITAMRELDSGKGMGEVARMYQLSRKRLETWRSEWRAKGELAFPGKGAQPQIKLDADRICELERKIGQPTMEIYAARCNTLRCDGSSRLVTRERLLPLPRIQSA
jgi:transposase-like protein